MRVVRSIEECVTDETDADRRIEVVVRVEVRSGCGQAGIEVVAGAAVVPLVPLLIDFRDLHDDARLWRGIAARRDFDVPVVVILSAINMSHPTRHAIDAFFSTGPDGGLIAEK